MIRSRFSLVVSTSLIAAVACSCFSRISAQEASKAGKTIIILDASGSMWGQIEGKPKIEIAREVIGGLLSDLDPTLELGLMAYGHREKGNCDDIELLLPPAPVDKAAFLAKVNSILPKGKTPLTDAVERAAGYLQIEENAANVILVSDGLETCDRDPCELAGQLAAKGIAFRTHIVAFDLTAEESKTFRCLADETGGSFLQAQDAATLKDALEIAVEKVSTVSAPEEKMEKPKLDPATISAPATVPAGSEFELSWEGPGNKGDYLTIVPADAEDHENGNYVYTRQGSPCKLTAPIRPGTCEIRYRAETGEVLGRAGIEVTKVEATLKAPAEAGAGSEVMVEWTGPDNKGDYVTIVPKGAEAGTYKSYAYTANGNPAKVRALADAGEAEIRYVTGRESITLASIPLTILEADATLSAPEAVEAGSSFEVKWKGPNTKGDFITIVKTDAGDGAYESYAYTANSDDGIVSIIAPEDAGDTYEVRYVEGLDKKTLARFPVVIRPFSASVKGPESVVAGGEVKVEWFGPREKSWYVTIVSADAAEGKYGKYFYTANEESPTGLTAIEDAGAAEIRFVSAKGKTVASAPIEIIAATAEFVEVPAKVAAGEKFRVKWKGPDNKGDFITIVKPDAEEGAYGSYIYVQHGQDNDLTAPTEAGEYEIRYVTDQKKKTLAKKAIRVVAE